jgi:hypothetical protein
MDMGVSGHPAESCMALHWINGPPGHTGKNGRAGMFLQTNPLRVGKPNALHSDLHPGRNREGLARASPFFPPPGVRVNSGEAVASP